MPKETFYNLPDEKRKLIEDTAITEFAANGFDKASINTIVLNAGIAKGSFYQYFTEKKDLFLYILLSVIAQKKIKYLSELITNQDKLDFFTFIKELFISGLKFASENPELEKISSWIINNTTHPVYQDLMSEAGDFSLNFYETMVNDALLRGEFREGIDGKYISYIFPSLMTDTMDYCLKNSEKKNPAGLSGISDEIMQKVDFMLDFLKHGIGNDKDTRSNV
jgi:AcrR family transcriptional regulator